MMAEMSAELEQLALAARGSMTDVAAGWVTPQYLLSLRRRLAEVPEGAERFKLLRKAAGDVVALQHGGHSAARVQLERERLDLNHQKYRDATAAAQKEIQKLRDPKLQLSDEDRQAIVDKADEILGLK